MPVPFNETMYPEVQQWLSDNPQDESLSPQIKQTLLRFEELTEPEKVQLQAELLAVPNLPDVLQQFIPDRLGAQPVELLNIIGEHLAPQDKRELAAASKAMHSVFHQSNLHDKFLECVAYGQQDKAERLLSHVFQGQPAKTQGALLHQGTLTTYAGETFNCSAYEYAYWAKDTHMCRMLERYMNDETKAQMLIRINTIESEGLAFQQNGAEHRSAHFDFTPLKAAYQRYLDGYNGWYNARNWAAMDAAWLEVGKAQSDVPAHVAQEYCHPDRAFDPLPSFNVDREDIPVDTLPRRLTFYNWNTSSNNSWFPLAASNSGLGFDFAIIRAALASACRDGRPLRHSVAGVAVDLAAIARLDEVRTVDLTLSREHLNPPALSQSIRV